ncbi:HAMP domain-containing histidine kinase [Peptostreptococcaceae bacterium OttesenSCG-928-C18]|nr:HAMP domain-containing histidine kinase [Peptostreptococcaceae bacterium OttesenSCG-928-C18]
MKKRNKKIIQQLLTIYFIVIVCILLPVLIIGGEIVESFISNYIFIFLVGLVISFFINYFFLKRLNDSLNVEDITNIVISEVFHGNKLYIEYNDEIKNMLKKLEDEKELSIYSMEKYKESEKIRTEFTANVTHELKTPLTSIIGYAELIEMGFGNETEIKKFAKTINEDSRKLLLMIEDIITLSRYDDLTSIKIEFEYFNMGDFVEELTNNIESIASKKNIKIYKKIEDLYVYADKGKIKDLVNNLLSNAIKYNKDNGVIKVNLFKKDDNVILEIEDTGIGIPSDDKARIFERFFVVDKSRGKGAGSGLGLSIVKHVALIHNGTVDLESKEGTGSKFIFEFPMEQKQD